MLEAKFVEAMYENKLEFPRGVQNKKPSVGGHGSFLELHISLALLQVTNLFPSIMIFLKPRAVFVTV